MKFCLCLSNLQVIQQISVSSTSFQSVFEAGRLPTKVWLLPSLLQQIDWRVKWCGSPSLASSAHRLSSVNGSQAGDVGGKCIFWICWWVFPGKQEPDLDSNAYALLVLRMVLPAFSSWGKLTLSVGFRPPIYVIPKFFIARQHHWGLYQPLWLDAESYHLVTDFDPPIASLRLHWTKIAYLKLPRRREILGSFP